MKTKYDIGNMVYIPFQIYRIEVSETTKYIARGYGEEWKHLSVSLTEEGVDMYSVRGSDDQPAVDAEPVRHGKWIETEENHGFDDEVRNKALSCSVCRVAFRISDYSLIEDFRYCPHCGARMDETQKKPCGDCQQFDCYGCEYAERKEDD